VIRGVVVAPSDGVIVAPEDRRALAEQDSLTTHGNVWVSGKIQDDFVTER
jgi:hypothetical protein